MYSKIKTIIYIVKPFLVFIMFEIIKM